MLRGIKWSFNYVGWGSNKPPNLNGGWVHLPLIPEKKAAGLQEALFSKRPPTGSCNTPNGSRCPVAALSLSQIEARCTPTPQSWPLTETYRNLAVARCPATGPSLLLIPVQSQLISRCFLITTIRCTQSGPRWFLLGPTGLQLETSWRATVASELAAGTR